MENKITIDDINVEQLNFERRIGGPIFIINDGNLLKKETLQDLPYRFLLISSKKRLDIYTPYYHDAIDSRFAPFGGAGEEYANILVNEILPKYLNGVDVNKIYYGGISLGGLHAVYSSSLKNFPLVNFFSICGSFWFPEFTTYLQNNACAGKSFYILNGKKEGLNHSNTPLSNAYTAAEKVSQILLEKNDVVFVGDNYSHHDHLNERFLSLIEKMAVL